MYFCRGEKKYFPRSKSALPFSKIKTYASWGGTAEFNNVQFYNFKSNKTYCGNNQFLFEDNPDSADYTPKHKFTNTKFIDVDQSTFGFLMDPPLAWANLDDCSEFPCTGPMNVLTQFENSQFSGVTPRYTNPNFQLISNNKGVGLASGCVY